MTKKERIAKYIQNTCEIPMRHAEEMAEHIIGIEDEHATADKICDTCDMKLTCGLVYDAKDECLSRTGEGDPEDVMELGNLFFGNSRGLFHIDRSWSDKMYELFGAAGLDSYGYAEEKKATIRGGFQNGIFRVEPYYWGDDEEIADEPNFWYYPTGFELAWYKYPLRDSYCNQRITYLEFCEIIKKCIESVKR